jgi:hemoglobin
MKQLLSLFFVIILASCATPKEKSNTEAEQVAGLQTMCKESEGAIKERQAKNSLYDRLGGREKIGTFALNLFHSHKNNKQIGHMFKHVQEKPFVGHVTEFLVVGTGGKGNYTGRDMESVHKHLKITNAAFLSAGGDVQATMKALNYGDNEIQEVVCALVSFIPDVVVQK